MLDVYSFLTRILEVLTLIAVMVTFVFIIFLIVRDEPNKKPANKSEIPLSPGHPNNPQSNGVPQ